MLKKSKNILFKYEYKGCYINKSLNIWFVHANDIGIKIETGLKAKTLKILCTLIDQSLASHGEVA